MTEKCAYDALQELSSYLAKAKIIRDERDTLMARHERQVETIRHRIDIGGLSQEEKQLLLDLGFETNYDRRNFYDG
jgi:hypothetical protein